MILLELLGGLFLARLVQKIPQPGSDHGPSPLNLLARGPAEGTDPRATETTRSCVSGRRSPPGAIGLLHHQRGPAVVMAGFPDMPLERSHCGLSDLVGVGASNGPMLEGQS